MKRALRRAALIALGVAADLTPIVRMTSRQTLPPNMSAGILGAELATWAAISPSLLPRPWWVTAANVAIGQGIGHLGAASTSFVLNSIGKRPQDRLGPQHRQILHLAIGAGTTFNAMLSLRNQKKQAELVNKQLVRGPATAAIGLAAGTAGYGTLLLIGEATQLAVTRLSRQLGRWVPALVAWPVATAGLSLTTFALSDRVVFRRWLRSLSHQAQRINRQIFPGTSMPWEPERSGSPWSLEPWSALGQQGRRFVSNGPRARDIRTVTGTDAKEPIRIYAGYIPGRSFQQSAEKIRAELERTGALRRETIVIQMPAGSGWINNWGACSYEFLTGGDCVTVTMQYSYLPSVFSYLVDKNAPKQAARELIRVIQEEIDRLPKENRPRLYFAGESLGAYAIMDNYHNAEDLLSACNGAVFSGPPRMTHFTQRLRRDIGSLERLPVIDGGKHVRYAAAPDHTLHDAFGNDYAHTWRRPRMLIAQHASDAIVWWDLNLLVRRPTWIHEPQPEALHADTFRQLHWVPFITWWQIGLDQINSLNVPGGHGHNYFEEMLWYWDEVLGSQSRQSLTPKLAKKIARFIRREA
ncbi:alpha/beta-hydrolase family protein [Corynebacterium tuberculostearicum]|uniref:alpha/beta-hydrolase family protein n=1 Tax=Corynebacterium tuberculostearicum TaxID=38304 RepID=UPI002934C5A5|nr:alpha/beta-hydrolase family protein [Corynebacterium tuberculostearicum]MDV2433094.1 alpha/beta-hydrolase family protein [Corynebacterium tuberculostearicum]